MLFSFQAVEGDMVDTTGIVLSEELRALVMRLAVNSHEEWAARKLASGVVYGKYCSIVQRPNRILVSSYFTDVGARMLCDASSSLSVKRR